LDLWQLDNLNQNRVSPIYQDAAGQQIATLDGPIKYWLYHVWALRKKLDSQTSADEAMERFLRKNPQQARKAYERVGALFYLPNDE